VVYSCSPEGATVALSTCIHDKITHARSWLSKWTIGIAAPRRRDSVWCELHRRHTKHALCVDSLRHWGTSQHCAELICRMPLWPPSFRSTKSPDWSTNESATCHGCVHSRCPIELIKIREPFVEIFNNSAGKPWVTWLPMETTALSANRPFVQTLTWIELSFHPISSSGLAADGDGRRWRISAVRPSVCPSTAPVTDSIRPHQRTPDVPRHARQFQYNETRDRNISTSRGSRIIVASKCNTSGTDALVY